MAVVLQVVCVLFIFAAVIVFARQNSRSQIGSSGLQMAPALYRVVLCEWFFGLCVSDILDINAGFSYVRFAVNVFYARAFSAAAVYTFIYKTRGRTEGQKE